VVDASFNGRQRVLNKFLERVDKLGSDLRPYIPFTALNTVWRSMDRGGMILDVGCGKGEPMRFIKRHKRFYTIGVDIFEPYLKQCQHRNTHDDYVLCDIKRLPFKDKSFDTVLCLEVLEHLEREDGQRLLEALEKIARNRVIISTPVGTYKQEAYDDNPHQEHRYVWVPAEMKKFGYKVRGCGVRNISGMSGIQSPIPKVLRPLVNIVWVLAGPLAYFFPKLAGDMICTKNF
jgi:SAM-dependent methyltransferase